MAADLILSEELPNDLLPYTGRFLPPNQTSPVNIVHAGRLTPRFFECRRKIVEFIKEVPWPASIRDTGTRMPHTARCHAQCTMHDAMHRGT